MGLSPRSVALALVLPSARVALSPQSAQVALSRAGGARLWVAPARARLGLQRAGGARINAQAARVHLSIRQAVQYITVQPPPAGGEGGSAAFAATLPAGVGPGSCVALAPGGALAAPYPVWLAGIGTLGERPAAGVVVTTAGQGGTVLTYGPCSLFSGLIPGRQYFVGADGYPALPPVLAPAGGGPYYLQPIGYALSPNVLFVRPLSPTARVGS